MKLRKALLLLLSLALSLGLLTGCGGGQEEVFYNLVQSKYGDVTVSVPSTWEVLSGELNEDADLELASEDRSHFLMAMIVDGTAFEGELSDYQKEAAKSLEQTYGVDLDKPETDSVAGYPAYRFEFTAGEEGKEAYFRVYVLRTESYILDIYTWSAAERKDDQQDNIRGILDSLKEKDLPEIRTLSNGGATFGFTAVPKGWYLHSGATDGSEELYLSALDQSSMIYATTLKKAGIPGGFAYFDEVMMGSMEDTYSVTLKGTGTEKQLEGSTAVVYEFEDGGIHYWLYNVESETRFSTLLAAVETKDLEEGRAEVEALLNSFVEL